MFSLRRKLGIGGFTEWAEVVENEQFFETVRRYCGFYQPLGPTNFQFRVHKGNLKLLEINPRISSASSIRAAFGYNEAEMALGYFLEGRLPAVPLTKRGQAVRYVEDHIIQK
jgi:carbamoyl-phosphate synthase large subunit